MASFALESHASLCDGVDVRSELVGLKRVLLVGSVRKKAASLLVIAIKLSSSGAQIYEDYFFRDGDLAGGADDWLRLRGLPFG